MGDNVEVFFPSRREDGVSDEAFEQLRIQNLERGRKVGIRGVLIPGAGEPEVENQGEKWYNSEKVEVQLRMLSLEKRIKTMEKEFDEERKELIRQTNVWKVDSSDKGKEITALVKRLDGTTLSKEEVDELKDELKHVQSEHLEATREAGFLRNKIQSLEKKLREERNERQENDYKRKSKVNS